MNQDFVKQLNVLVVDDIAMNRKVAGLMLKKIGCTVVEEAENGQIAINLSKTKHYHIILMDINMPVMNGDESTQVIKNSSDIKPIIVGLSAEAMEGDYEKHTGMGMDDYLTKTIKLDKLKETIKKFETEMSKNNELLLSQQEA